MAGFFHGLIMLVAATLVVATFPALIELVMLTLGGILPPSDRRLEANHAGDRPVRLAIVIPAFNEAGSISRCVASLAGCIHPGPDATVQIVVVADNCTDATAERATAAGARVIPRTDPIRRGKGFALQYAFDHLLAEGVDAVAVADADTEVEANFVVEILRLLASGADGVQARYGVLHPEASPRARLMAVAFMAMNVLRPRGRARWGWSAGILGNGFALSRAALAAVPYDAHSIVEDLEYHLRLVRAGRRIAFADRTTVRGAIPAGSRAAGQQRARWEGGRLRMVLEHAPALLREVLRDVFRDGRRGRLRLLEPLLELLLPPLAILVTALLVLAVIPLAPARLYGAVALALVALHVAAGIMVGGGGRADWIALLRAPGYMLWKLAVAPQIFKAAGRETRWVRTQR